MSEFNASGSKYLVDMVCVIGGKTDVYAVLDAFGVTCPARQHAIKKLLCAGLRGKADEAQDLSEAREAIDRAMQMHASREEARTVNEDPLYVGINRPPSARRDATSAND